MSPFLYSKNKTISSLNKVLAPTSRGLQRLQIFSTLHTKIQREYFSSFLEDNFHGISNKPAKKNENNTINFS